MHLHRSPRTLQPHHFSAPSLSSCHNLAVTVSNPAPTTCFGGSETGLPSGKEKGRRPETSAFLRSIASCGSSLRCGRASLLRGLGPTRDSRLPDQVAHRRPLSAPNSRPSHSLPPLGLTAVASAQSLATGVRAPGFSGQYSSKSQVVTFVVAPAHNLGRGFAIWPPGHEIRQTSNTNWNGPNVVPFFWEHALKNNDLRSISSFNCGSWANYQHAYCTGRRDDTRIHSVGQVDARRRHTVYLRFVIESCGDLKTNCDRA